MHKRGKSPSEGGFTLIEVMVAVILITLVIAPLEGLLIRAEKISRTAQQRFVATNLAQEGLELVRAARDNNWFSSTEPKRWLDHGLCQDGDTSYEDNNRSFTIDPDLVREGLVGDIAQSNLFVQGNGSWSHAISPATTPFMRQMTIDCSTKNAEQPYVTVTAIVTWQERDQTQEVVIKEKLYNWYPLSLADTP